MSACTSIDRVIFVAAFSQQSCVAQTRGAFWWSHPELKRASELREKTESPAVERTALDVRRFPEREPHERRRAASATATEHRVVVPHSAARNQEGATGRTLEILCQLNGKQKTNKRNAINKRKILPPPSAVGFL